MIDDQANFEIVNALDEIETLKKENLNLKITIHNLRSQIYQLRNGSKTRQEEYEYNVDRENYEDKC